MKFVTVRDLRLTPGKVWELAKQERRIVLTANGRPMAILTGVDENSLEEDLDAIERAQALVALDRIHQDSLEKGTDRISEREIDAEYLEVLKRPKFELTHNRVQTILAFIRSRGVHAPALPHSLDLPHHDDEPFLEAALSAGADALVTGNTRHFPEDACKGICVLTPDEFLQTLPSPLSVP